MEKLRYSDRKRLAEDGSLGPLEYGTLSDGLRHAIASIYENAATSLPAGMAFDKEVVATCEQHFGRTFYGVNASDGTIQRYVKDSSRTVDQILDLVEILVEQGPVSWTYEGKGTFAADSRIEKRINAAFVRYRFGYRVDQGEVHRIGSPALDEAVVGPALLALRRPGWEAADKSFRDALHHQRGGPSERDAAITDAHAALEAAMKAAGLPGDRLSALAKSFRNSRLVPSQLESVPDLLDDLLKRSSSIRDSMGDVHGKSPDAAEVPPEIADLAIHWTGAFIVYLAEATAS